MKKLVVVTIALVLSFALAVPDVAASDGEGAAYGQHHAAHARAMGGFTGDMNPGVMHRGFSGWHDHHHGGHE